MSIELKKIAPVELRTIGLDEKWLQDRIMEDPKVLGLGDLEIAGREHRQPMGGRIDFLMRDPEAGTYYEVEVMLGALDESHIIRTIEYWDIERQRRPQSDHIAVIVAEHITGRFFNIVRLLNRAVPLIAIKLSAFQIENNSVVLHPVTVLDVIEETDLDSVDQAEETNRAYWEKNVIPSSLAIFDRIISALQGQLIIPKLTYNRHHIAIGTTGYNFCWFNPRKTENHGHIEIRLTNEMRDAVLTTLRGKGIDCSPRRADNISLNLTTENLTNNTSIIIETIKKAEEISR